MFMADEKYVYSREDFLVMRGQILCQEPVSYQMLVRIVQGSLPDKISGWCQSAPELRMRGLEEDLLQEIQIKLIKEVPFFLLKEGPGGRPQDDHEWFIRWVYAVAHNVVRDQAASMRSENHRIRQLEENEEPTAPTVDPEEEKRRQERLRSAFDIVLEADVQVYKSLTWLVQCMYILNQDLTKIQATEKLVEECGEMTLRQMQRELYRNAGKLPWMQISPRQQERIEAALQAPYDRDRTYGQVRYKEFFMKKGGKATVSDWVNRLNSLIKRVTDYEAFNS